MPARFVTVAAALVVAPPAMADEVVHAVVNIDLMPSDQAAGTKILTEYVQRARQDPNVLSVALIQQDGTSNHFILLETFVNRTAYDVHVQSDHVRSFRAALYPHLGSPWDERLGNDRTR
ncbi:putative quinol monooxygenase [Methylobacterium oryzae]|jgi:quinol monooxygenase YgiN|uniref:putative quinol monooxygenase n=1 Tax=Methylobacterium oryzae TaxID=334852 RepID=UPI002F31EDBF